MIDGFEVVTLCGSTRFKEDFLKAQEEFTLAGYIVLSVGLFSKANGKAISPNTRGMLDMIHKKKIDLADTVYIINKDDYIGASTAEEIEYAKSKNKKILYMYPHKNVD